MKIISECLHFTLRCLPGLYTHHPLTTKCSHPEPSPWELWSAGPTSSSSYFCTKVWNSWRGWSGKNFPVGIIPQQLCCRHCRVELGETAAWQKRLREGQSEKLRLLDEPAADGNSGFLRSYHDLSSILEWPCSLRGASSPLSQYILVTAPSCDTSWAACPLRVWLVTFSPGFSPCCHPPQAAFLPLFPLLHGQVAQKGSGTSREAFPCPVLEWFCGDH